MRRSSKTEVEKGMKDEKETYRKRWVGGRPRQDDERRNMYEEKQTI